MTFETTIHESNPEAYYIFTVEVSLHDGSVLSSQIIEGREQFFEKIPFSVKSKLKFYNAEMKEGFVTAYYIVLQNGRSYIFLVRKADSGNHVVGGNYMTIEDFNTVDHLPLLQYLNKNARTWQSLYQRKEEIALIDSLNKSMTEIHQIAGNI